MAISQVYIHWLRRTDIHNIQSFRIPNSLNGIILHHKTVSFGQLGGFVALYFISFRFSIRLYDFAFEVRNMCAALLRVYVMLCYVMWKVNEEHPWFVPNVGMVDAYCRWCKIQEWKLKRIERTERKHKLRKEKRIIDAQVQKQTLH